MTRIFILLGFTSVLPTASKRRMLSVELVQAIRPGRKTMKLALDPSVNSYLSFRSSSNIANLSLSPWTYMWENNTHCCIASQIQTLTFSNILELLKSGINKVPFAWDLELHVCIFGWAEGPHLLDYVLLCLNYVSNDNSYISTDCKGCRKVASMSCY